MRTKAGISGPPLTPSMRAGPENVEGRSPWRENNDSLPIQIPRPGDTHFVQFKEEKLIQFFFFFSGEKQKFRSSRRFWPPTGYIAT